MIKSKKLLNKKKITLKGKNKSRINKKSLRNRNRKRRTRNNEKKLSQHILKGGDLLNNISGSNIGKEESNSMMDSILGKNTKNEGLVTRILKNVSLPGYLQEKSVTKDSKQLKAKEKIEEKNEKDRLVDVLKKKEEGDTEYFDEEMVLEEERKLAMADKKREDSQKLGNSGLFSGISERFSQQFSDADASFSGLDKNRAEQMDKVKNLSRTKTCSPIFVSGLNTLLGTCAKEELVDIYNQVIQRLKNKDLNFSYELENEIFKLKNLVFDNKVENDIDTNVNIVDLNKTVDNDYIADLESTTTKRLLQELDNENNRKKQKKQKKK